MTSSTEPTSPGLGLREAAECAAGAALRAAAEFGMVPAVPWSLLGGGVRAPWLLNQIWHLTRKLMKYHCYNGIHPDGVEIWLEIA